MELLDLLPYETALQRLVRAGVCRDDQLHDYNTSQALRSIAYAVNRTSLPVPEELQTRSLSSLVPHDASAKRSSSLSTSASLSAVNGTFSGNVVVLCRICLSSLVSYGSMQAMVYLSTRLLCDESTNFGVGNERPCCSAAWVEALCSIGSNSYLREQMSLHRRLALGYMFVLSGTVRIVGRACVVGKRLASHFAKLTRRILDEVVPFMAVIADASDEHAALQYSNAPDVVSNDTSFVVMRAPSRLRVETNNALIHLFHDITLDVMDVHRDGKKQIVGSPAVLDRDMPTRIWPALSILRGALARALNWVQSEALWHVRSADISDTQKEIQGINESMAVVKSVLETIFSSLVQQQEKLECSRQVVERQFGLNAKDYHEATEMMWSNTLKLCFLCRNITNAWIQIHGGVGDTDVLQTDKKVLGFIASLVSSTTSLDGNETDTNVFVTTTLLLSAAFAAVMTAPAPSMRAALWSADLALTHEVHNVIIQRTLRYRDESVQRLSALLSQMILYSSTTSSAVQVISDSSNQLLELISDGRDAASRCVTGMLTRAAIHRPHAILPALFRLLQKGDVRTRRNVLDVLSPLPQSCDDPVYGEGLTREQMRPMLRLLSEELLLRLHDEELFIRLESSKLFAKVWPEDVCRPLLNLALQRDKSAKRQSAAQQALRCVVEAQTMSSNIVLLLLEESLALLGEGTLPIRTLPSTPADILALSKLHSSTLVSDAGEKKVESDITNTESGNVSERLLRLVVSLVRRWGEMVPKWERGLLDPILKRVMQARLPLEQELLVRMMSQVAALCGATNDGMTALLSSCLYIMRPEQKEDGTSVPCLWLDTLSVTGEDYSDSSITTGNSEFLAYQRVAPLLCLRGCPQQAFTSPVIENMTPLLAELWELLWMILLSSKYRNILSSDAQRLLLELVCKYGISLVLQRLSSLESCYLENKTAVWDVSFSDSRFICRVGFFCIGFLLSQNKTIFHGSVLSSDSVEEKERVETELRDLLSAATMTSNWTEHVILPWLLRDDGDSAYDTTFLADAQRLCRSAVECLGLLTVVALKRNEFDEAVVAPIMRPLTELAAFYRKEVKHLEEVSGEVGSFFRSDDSFNTLGRFEFAIQVHQCALSLLRTCSSGTDILCLWISKYMPCFIELANASCAAAAAAAAARLPGKDFAQVSVECCRVLFLAVMVSSGAGPLHSTGGEASSHHLQQKRPQWRQDGGETTYAEKSILICLDATDRNALIAFALGSAKYSALPQVQSEGVKLLSALLGAAPELFVDDSAWNYAAFTEAFGVLESVALMHPDSKTRVLAEQVLKVIQENAKQ